ncbi:response regulator transcription factor [Chloroflexus sp. MS-CIW-1]|jgi:DNA-binding NarL/FixJ family response regulator|uniref:response regulator n=1 Tax=unclassified Chloroflexus TaxID=2633855 RepID=UPI0004DFB5F8|nr:MULTISPECIES: response regulator transcription factor [unclassified Chloroflexus]MBO9349588.1 response regulator transcription factor [Chloroflexus sp.]MDN5271360.1 response regulator transcription factor [Chloroflexus sp. MS-CIW-1]
MTIRVLIVDDQALIRTGIATLLARKADIEVVGQAANGREALDLVAALDPDVVLMDVMMPIMDGVEATRQLTQRGPRPAVIMLTTFHDDERVLQSIAAGARGYLLKDVDHRVLADSIRTVAGGGALIHPQITAQLLPRIAQMASATPPQTTAPPDVAMLLTPREREILRLLAQGFTNQEIGEHLALSIGTVKNHLSVIFAKLAVRDRTQAALWAREHLQSSSEG